MANRPKQKGTWAETQVLNYLKEHLFPHGERRVLAGSQDRGDLNVHPQLVFEVKNCARVLLGPWVVEAAREATRARARYGFVVYKVPGMGAKNVGKWRVAMFDTDSAELAEEAGIFVDATRVTGRGFSGVGKVLDQPHEHPHFALAHAPGNTDPRFEYAVCTLEDLVKMLKAAGYGEGLVNPL